VVLILVCIMLVALSGLLYFLWVKIRSLRLDKDAYSFLRDADEGEIAALESH
jgi:hypothetical protein